MIKTTQQPTAARSVSVEATRSELFHTSQLRRFDMKKATLTLLTATSACTLVATANAAVLASWDTWSNNAVGNYDADATLAGFSAAITNTDTGNRANSGGFGSTDGTFGTAVAGAATTDNTALLVRKGNTGTNDSGWNLQTITITNNTGSAYNIESIHFDIGARGTAPNDSGDAYTLTYVSGGLGPASTVLGSATGITNIGNQGDADDFDITLAASLSDITLADGESAVFELLIDDYGSNSASATLDNVAFQGSLVPEPGSLALLGLGGLLIAARRRRG
jgi:hypothetical protein